MENDKFYLGVLRGLCDLCAKIFVGFVVNKKMLKC